jgi:hypothetical protein
VVWVTFVGIIRARMTPNVRSSLINREHHIELLHPVFGVTLQVVLPLVVIDATQLFSCRTVTDYPIIPPTILG